MILDFHPQSVAEAIGANSCLANCYLFCAKVKPDVRKYNDLILKAMSCDEMESGIDEDCFITSASTFIKFTTGLRCKVIKQDVTDIKDIVEPTPVRYRAEGYIPHWVVVANGEIIFNPKEKSKSVQYGKPDTMRVIYFN